MENFKETLQEETFDIKEFLYKMMGYWYLFVVGIFSAITITFCINKWTSPVYEVKTSLLVQDEKSLLDAKFTGGMNLYNNTYRLSNEIGILKSYTLTQRALNKLDFSIAYFTSGNFAIQELYTSCPFIFVADSASPQPLYTDIKLKVLSATDFKIEAEAKDVYFYSFLGKKVIQQKPKFEFSQTEKINQPWYYFSCKKIEIKLYWQYLFF
jgi:tyrosine-protein kinase Etk/Wzc